ncbi:abortive phage infection [Levilactobacillus koreensis JCM 16448]|uniref:Abortive phage infection protein C-terminal domain-containing protein n=1 Tax=Levilactobacillus koreensis TaxID=637971 RepID=A0AAC9ERA6_9LACO|nr:AIPR family protein [Levilactobacillus koreensis]AKP64497.1 hypothetical protein ABN16_05470 [Levilactobacillus koreensis]KRK89734.1 abortive phage infection [Levilactobacillus koreensis JCM 16448]
MATQEFKVTTDQFRTVSAPNNISRQRNEKQYFLLVNFADLPSDFPTEVNPRAQKMHTKVAVSLINGVTNNESDFYLNNRGIVLSAKSISYNPKSKSATIDLGDGSVEDNNTYGVIDGGHTYRAIIENRDEVIDLQKKYVRLEVITGVENLTALNSARNSSVSVSEQALANLAGKADFIKNDLKGSILDGKVSFKDNENLPVEAIDLVRLMFVMNIEEFGEDSAPTSGYSTKTGTFKRFEKSIDTAKKNNTPSIYLALSKKLPELVELYEHIEQELPQYYSAYKKNNGQKITKFGRVTGVTPNTKKDQFSTFTNTPITYSISSGYIYPIFASLRALLKYDISTNSLDWAVSDPEKFLDGIGYKLAETAFESNDNNPNKTGKDPQVYKTTYATVELSMLKELSRHN